MTARGGSTVRGLVVLGGGTALAALLGLGFQSLLAYWFGAGAETDAFFMSLSIYGFLGKFLMLSHLRSLALPVYARLRGADPQRARRLAGGLLGLTVALVTVLSVVLLAAAPLLVDLLAPGYAGPLRDLTVLLLRIRVPALLFLAGTTVAMAFLESEQRFGVTISAQKVVPAAAALVLLLAVADRSGIAAVAWTGLAATVGGALVILPSLRGRVGSPALAPAARDPELRALGRRWLGLSSSNAATFVGEWAFRVGASLLPVGLFSAVLYGRMVHDLLHAGINDSAQTLALPRFARAVANDRAELGPPLRSALNALAAVSLPLSLLVAATAPWSVALLFGRGRFLADGMLEPAAVSLALFMLGFFLQGLVQILFSAAFATDRAELVNRTQLIGHLARAAALVPMVWWFSYVGLVGSQVAMNALVLALLVARAPAEWGLRALARDLLRPVLAAALPAALYLLVVAPRLPEPTAISSVGRLLVLAALSTGWLVAYAAIATALGLPEAIRLLRRLRRAAATAATPVLAALIVHDGAAAQTAAGWAPLGERHWVIPVVEWMEARGEVPAGSSSMRPLPAARAAALLGPSEVGARLVEERGRDVVAAGGLLVRGGDTVSHVQTHLRIDVGGPTDLPFGFVEVEGERLLRAGVGVRAGKLWAALARERVQLGGGATGAIVLNPSAPLEGVIAGTAEPTRLAFLGDVSVIAGVGPLGRYEAVEDPWWGYLRVTARPTPWLQIGASRAALAGGYFGGGTVEYDAKVYGADDGSMSGGDVLGLIAGRNTGFDDQLFALDVRTSWSRFGAPLLTYLELGWEDADRSWGDAALVAGVLWALDTAVPVALRYEYAAFGKDARWCRWCDTLPAFWYRHVRFQSGWQVDGELLGHPLGGYGREHAAIATIWTRDARLRAELRLAALDRQRWNLLEADRPGGATSAGLTAAWRARGWLELASDLRDERGDGWRRSAWALRASVLSNF